MLPIDKEENCKRMLATGQYQIPRSRGKEDKWLFAYLKKNGVSRNEAYKIWLPIFQTRYFSYKGQVDSLYIFDDLWEDTNGVRFQKREEIMFYEEEVSFIKNLKLPRWEKEYFMMLFSVIKARGSNSFSDLCIGELLKFTSIRHRRGDEYSKIFEDGYHLGIFKDVKTKRWDSIRGCYEKKEFKTLCKIESCGKLIYQFKSLVDVPSCFNELFGFERCEVCGKNFEINSKTKRHICKDCWMKKEREKARIRMKNLRKSKCSGE